MTPPDANLFITSQCPHCATLINLLTQAIKGGQIARLTITNLNQDPDAAKEHNIQSVPTLLLGSLRFEGLMSKQALDARIGYLSQADGIRQYFEDAFRDGNWQEISAYIQQFPDETRWLLEILTDEDAELQARLGASAVFEDIAGSEILHSLIPQLGEMAQHPQSRVRADAAYLLDLTQDARVTPMLKKLQEDESPEVREIAEEAVESLGQNLH